MKKIGSEFIHHLFHYAILISIFLGGITMFILYRAFPYVQLLVGTTTAVSYIVWGIVHHYIDEDLSLKIIMEYLSIGIFAIIILWNVLVI